MSERRELLADRWWGNEEGNSKIAKGNEERKDERGEWQSGWFGGRKREKVSATRFEVEGAKEEEKRAAVGPRRRRDAENEEESGGRRRHAGEAGVAAAVHTSRYEQRPPSPGSPNASGKVEETNDKVATPTVSWRGRRSALCACDLDGRSGRGDAAGGIRDIRGKPRGIRAGCFLIFEAADRVMDVRGRPKLMVDDY